MRTVVEFIIKMFFKFILWFRYRVTVKGLEKLTPEALNRPGGILFLPNHPTVFIDPVLSVLAVWKKFSIRPMIIEYMYYAPLIHPLMKFMNALPIPNFDTSSNSLKRKRSERVLAEVAKELRNGENFLIYPAGHTKHQAREVLGGASGVHKIVQDVPEANVVLVRFKGLWGSSFSRALTGKSPPMFAAIWEGVKHVFKNLVFFTPRREVVIEFEPVPADFPYNASRREFNAYLEEWYNRPDGLTEQEGEHPGDSLVLRSYSMWGEELPDLHAKEEDEVDIGDIPQEVQEKVVHKLAELTEHDPAAIKPSLSLGVDLGLDSLDAAEIGVFLKEEFDITGVPFSELTSVGRLMAIASKKVVIKQEIEEEIADLSKWKRPVPRFRAQVADGETIPEVFLNNCDRMGSLVACADLRSGILTYSQLKVRALLLAEYIRHLPGKYIGILLPASTAAYTTVFACQIAGKVPLLINWTVGPRHLESVVDLSKVEAVISSWVFLDQLGDVELGKIDDLLIFLEDVARETGVTDKLQAYLRSKRGTKALLKTFGIQNKTKDDAAVLLFTSGTESLPKGVPLTHGNVLSNQRASYEAMEIYSDDVMYGFLPPFHVFGFSISGIAPLLGGVKIVYYSDPTNGEHLAKDVEKWGVTFVCGAPTFVKGMIKAATPDQLKSVHLCVTGAEKAPPDLIRMMAELGKEDCFFEGYGITECSPVLTVGRMGKPKKGVGEPVSGVELLIVQPETLVPMVNGEQGLILARGPNVFSGYINPGISSPFVKVEGKEWYHTGDLGYFDEDGQLMISGRIKRFLKVGGEMVSLPSVEHALLQVAAEKEWTKMQEDGPMLAICGKEHPGEKPKIFLFTRFPASLEMVNQALREKGFSNLIRVSEVVELPEIPVMGTGKINYRSLEEKYMAE